MSGPGCPYDNAAMENLFGTLKTECLYQVKFTCREEVEQAVAEYVQFYKYERINLKTALLRPKFGARPPNPMIFCDRDFISLSVQRGSLVFF